MCYRACDGKLRHGSDKNAVVLRKLEPDESAQQMRWLCGDTWPPKDGGTGFDPADGWPAAVWVLNAMYERDDIPSNLTQS